VDGMVNQVRYLHRRSMGTAGASVHREHVELQFAQPPTTRQTRCHISRIGDAPKCEIDAIIGLVNRARYRSRRNLVIYSRRD